MWEYLEFNKIKQYSEIADTFKPANVSELKDDKKLRNLEILYAKIMFYIEKNKAYLNPDFSLEQLTAAVGSNQNYVSNALKTVGKTNFRDFVNAYRVRHILKDFKENKHKRFTIEYLCNRAGFAHQPRFNRAFKKVTGTSPTEYIRNLEKNHENCPNKPVLETEKGNTSFRITKVAGNKA